MTEAQLRETLADLSHEIWASWMLYLFSWCKQHESGGVLIPADFVRHWKRQIHTEYRDLTEKEQNSDREQADKILAVIQGNTKIARVTGAVYYDETQGGLDTLKDVIFTMRKEINQLKMSVSALLTTHLESKVEYSECDKLKELWELTDEDREEIYNWAIKRSEEIVGGKCRREDDHE